MKARRRCAGLVSRRLAEIQELRTKEATRSPALSRVGGRQPARVRADQVGLHQSASITVFGEQVDMHLLAPHLAPSCRRWARLSVTASSLVWPKASATRVPSSSGAPGCSWPVAGPGSRPGCRRCAGSGGRRPRANSGTPGRKRPRSRRAPARSWAPDRRRFNFDFGFAHPHGVPAG